VTENERKYDELKAINAAKQRRVRELQIANENRRNIVRPESENEHANEAYENQMKELMNSNDAMEAQESKYANLQAESQHLQVDLESLQERKQNM